MVPLKPKEQACDSCKRGPQQLLIAVMWQGFEQAWCARCVVSGVSVVMV